jgi:hypothetical protein
MEIYQSVKKIISGGPADRLDLISLLSFLESRLKMDLFCTEG